MEEDFNKEAVSMEKIISEKGSINSEGRIKKKNRRPTRLT
jgi:hypothetical protein